MTRIHHVVLCAVFIALMLAAGCTSTTNISGVPPQVTTQETAAATPVSTPPVAAGTTLPGAAGTQASGTCTADIRSDAANCGGCGYACPANAVCQEGQCFCREGYMAENNACVVAPAAPATDSGCPAGMSPCPDGYCYELAFSAENCGMCGNACPAGMQCSDSVCTSIVTETTAAPATSETTAPVTTTTTSSTGTSTTLGTLGGSKTCFIRGTTNCDGTCVNLTSNELNCGTCGHVCKSLAPECCDGTCVNLLTDESNCGACGHVCGALTTCTSGSCKSVVVVRTTALVKVSPSVKLINPEIVAPVVRI
jgi:hypothetical protein